MCVRAHDRDERKRSESVEMITVQQQQQPERHVTVNDSELCRLDVMSTNRHNTRSTERRRLAGDDWTMPAVMMCCDEEADDVDRMMMSGHHHHHMSASASVMYRVQPAGTSSSSSSVLLTVPAASCLMATALPTACWTVSQP